jgi:hypothetical protein
MTRISAATAILIFLSFFIASPAHAQSNSAADNGCFPWQEFKNGQCVAKPSQSPPPALPVPAPADTPPAVAPPPPPPPPVLASPCPDGGFRNSAGQCVCPAGTHPDAASGNCLADIVTRRPETIVCDGGTVSNGACVCPSGFNVMPAAGNAGGGTCVRTNAENCLGGELTVTGKCLCNGQVRMDGETYLLEYSNGKCLPMRCPVTALLRNGKCGSTTSAEPSIEPETKGRPAPKRDDKDSKETRDASDDGDHRRHCGRGRVMTHSGCVPAQRQLHDIYRQYYRNYRFPHTMY